MFKSSREFLRFRSFLLCFAVGSVAIAMATPTVADYRRSCQFEVEVKPTEDGPEDMIYTFRIFNTVEHRVNANYGRRAIRRYARDCVLAYWNDRSETCP